MVDRVNGTGNTAIAEVPSLRMIFLEFNPFEPPFDDARVRQAFNYAINKESLISDVLGGHEDLMKSVIIRGWLGYKPDELMSYPYDPEKALALLAEAGYGDGLTVDFWHPIADL